MNTIKKAALSGIAAIGLLASAAQAGTVIDWSPSATGGSGGLWSNSENSQNFGELFTLSSATVLTRMDIWTGEFFPTLGGSVVINIWADNAGTPGAALAEIVTQIDAIDNDSSGTTGLVRVSAPFSFALNAGTYWIGMAGNGYELAQLGYRTNAPGDQTMAQFQGDMFDLFTATTVGDMAFRLYDGDDLSPVPVPAGAPLMAGGLALGAWLRRRKATK